LEAGFIHETVTGHRPNKASWYAVTWRALDRLPGYDVGAAETFKRGAYQQNAPLKNASLRPSPVLERSAIGMSPVLERVLPSTSPVPMRGVFGALPSTSPVHHLDMPSIAVCLPGVGVVPAILTTETKTAQFDRCNYRRLTRRPTDLFTNLLH
jgi:hypothetical protein